MRRWRRLSVRGGSAPRRGLFFVFLHKHRKGQASATEGPPPAAARSVSFSPGGVNPPHRASLPRGSEVKGGHTPSASLSGAPFRPRRVNSKHCGCISTTPLASASGVKKGRGQLCQGSREGDAGLFERLFPPQRGENGNCAGNKRRSFPTVPRGPLAHRGACFPSPPSP